MSEDGQLCAAAAGSPVGEFVRRKFPSFVPSVSFCFNKQILQATRELSEPHPALRLQLKAG